jgi:hypothetical protein
VSKSSVKERRAHERHTTHLSVQGTQGPPGDGGGVVARMIARNLSAGGLYCTSSTDFPEMTRLAVRLMLPANGRPDSEAEPLDVEAIVVRREELLSSAGGERYELALFFTNLESQARRRIERYLAG